MLIAELAAAVTMSLAFVATGLLLLVEALFTLVALVFELLLNLVVRRPEARATPPREGWLRKLARSRWVRRAGIAAAGCLALTVGVALVLNSMFFEWSVRQIFKGVAARTGADVRFASAEGNLLTGRIALREVSIVRRNHPTTTADLRAREFALDLSVRSMIWGPRRVEDVRAIGLRGTVERLTGDASQPSAPWYARRRAVHIDRLLVEDGAVEWVDHTRPAERGPLRLRVSIERFAGEDFRTTWLAFDLLFRANGSGQIAGGAFHVSNERNGAGRRTIWRFERLPAEVLGDYVGGPFGWLTTGHGNVSATTAWGDPPQSLDMNWSFELVDVRAEVPAHLQGWQRRLAAAFVDHVNARGERLPLAFTFNMGAAGYEGAASAEAAGLWSAVADAATTEVATLLKVDRERIEDAKQKALDRLRAFRKKEGSP